MNILYKSLTTTALVFGLVACKGLPVQPEAPHVTGTDETADVISKECRVFEGISICQTLPPDADSSGVFDDGTSIWDNVVVNVEDEIIVTEKYTPIAKAMPELCDTMTRLVEGYNENIIWASERGLVSIVENTEVMITHAQNIKNLANCP